MKCLAFIALLAALPAMGADSEATRLQDSCGKFKIIPCATTLFTDHPFHIAVGGLAPGNGFAAGPALNFTQHPKPKHIPGPDGDTIKSWRLAWDADAVVSGNQSWRAGVYLKALYTTEPPAKPVEGLAPAKVNPDLRRPSWLITSYAETNSLNKLTFYGIGPDSSRSRLAYYGMRETVVGTNVVTPRWSSLKLTLFGEANVRVVSVRANRNENAPSIEQLFTPVTAPGMGEQKAFGQFGEGVRIAPAHKHLSVDYSFKFQEFVSGSKSTFERMILDLGHTYALYGSSTPRDFNGPDSCAASSDDKKAACPKPGKSNNLEGSVNFRFLLNDSFVSSGNSVPFYFQPTLGGGNINGESTLPSYADYRFRAPNLLLLRESFEHSLGKFPVGFIFIADQGKVTLTRDLQSGRFVHSFATGLTLRAGGFPVLSLLFAWGGGEGTHTLAQVSTSLLGGGGRPSLY